VLHYLSDKQPNVHALLVSCEAEREREVLTRFPNASQNGHHDTINAVRAFTAILKRKRRRSVPCCCFTVRACRHRQKRMRKVLCFGMNSMGTGRRLKLRCC
jgi:hypothetical protein